MGENLGTDLLSGIRTHTSSRRKGEKFLPHTGLFLLLDIALSSIYLFRGTQPDSIVVWGVTIQWHTKFVSPMGGFNDGVCRNNYFVLCKAI
jgi:hypothetical protein